MSQDPYVPPAPQAQPPNAFPSATQALGAGWEFCKSNFWTVAVMAGVAVLFNVLAQLPAATSDTPNPVLVSLLSILSGLVSILLALGLFRRAFDYWDETHGRAQPRGFGDGISSAIEGATPRLLPWIGWNLLIGVVLVVVLIPFIAIIQNTNSQGLVVLVGLVLWVGLLLASVYLAFIPTAIADGPGNPIETSMRVVGGHFWTVLGAFLLMIVFAFLAFIPLGIIVAILGQSALTAVVSSLYILVSVTVFEAVGLGAIVTMYRSVVQR